MLALASTSMIFTDVSSQLLVGTCSKMSQIFALASLISGGTADLKTE